MKSLISLLVVWAICLGTILLGAEGSVQYSGVSLFAISGVLIVLAQWVAFVPSLIKKTEHYYDLMGSITFITAIWLPIILAPSVSEVAVMTAVFISMWAVRLGSFLLWRVKIRGGDARFTEIMKSPIRFFFVWNLQATWVLVTIAPALYIATRPEAQLSALSWLGIEIAFLGLVIEAVADHQKMKHVRSGANTFMQTGLWARSQHPNYFGEIVVWFGVALMATNAMTGWAYLLWLSPLLVMFLLTRVSGVPLADKRAKAKYGDDPQWQEYVKTTPKLWPRLTPKR